MAELSLHELLRCQHVKRWHIVRTLREQTVAEHQWSVCMIALDLAERLEFSLDHGGGTLRCTLMEWALLHDSPEVILGDVPTPAKALLPDLTDAEKAVSENWDRLHFLVGGSGVDCIVRIADMIEAIRYLRIEGRGAHARSVHNTLMDRFARLVRECAAEHPQYAWDTQAWKCLQECTMTEDMQAEAIT